MPLIDEFRGMMSLVICAGLGFLLAMIFEVMYNNGWLVDRFITGSVTVFDVQIVTVIVFVIAGVLIGVFRRK